MKEEEEVEGETKFMVMDVAMILYCLVVQSGRTGKVQDPRCRSCCFVGDLLHLDRSMT